MFWKKTKKPDKKDNKIILGMVMLNDTEPPDLIRLINDYKSNYTNTIEATTGDNSAVVLTIAGDNFMVGHIPAPIPRGDIEGTSQYAYNWPNALIDTADHKSHLLVSSITGNQDKIARFKIFTEVICSLLRTMNTVGVYKGSQSLLIPKDDYLTEAKLMSDDYLPLNLWIYYGLRVDGELNSGYTYGLKEFGKTEMEVVNSSRSLEDIREFLFNISHYVLDYDVEFKNGETCGLSATEKIKIKLSKGVQTEGETFKLAY